MDVHGAVANNARWCDLMARAHGLAGRFSDQAWTGPARTPPLYPDAVTLVPDLDARDLLAQLDTGPGCTVKDSYATLDLGPAGFHVLFTATWIARPPVVLAGPGFGPGDPRPAEAPPPAPSWRCLDHPADLARWQRAWRTPGDPDDLFRPALLATPDVAFLAAEDDGAIVAGAILNAGPPGIAGVSNVFTRPGADLDPWPALLTLAGDLFPGRTLVGYESGPDLALAQRHGFHPLGPLRIWIKD